MRVISLLPSATEILFAIGAGDDVVAVTHECDHPAAAVGLPVVTRSVIDHAGRSPADIDHHVSAARHEGSSIYELDESLIRDLRPDLVITQELCDVCAVAYADVARAVRRLPGRVEVLSLEPMSVDDIISTCLTVGAATGRGDGARRLVAEMRGRVAAVAALPAPIARPRTVCLEWTDPLMAGGHWVPEMVALAGGVDVLGTRGEPSRYVEWDAVLTAQPGLLVLMPCGYELGATVALAPEVTGRPGFDGLACARSGMVAAVDGSAYFSRPGPRIVDGLEILAALVRGTRGSELPAGAAWVEPAQRAALA